MCHKQMVYMFYDGKMHIVEVPNKHWVGANSRYFYARKLLKIPDDKQVVWGELMFNADGVACLHFNFPN